MEPPRRTPPSTATCDESNLQAENGSGEWTLPTDDKSIELWHTSTQPSSDSKALYELSAVDFPRQTVLTKTEFTKGSTESHEHEESQTVTLFDLNQNHETKVVATDLNVNCGSALGTANDETMSHASSGDPSGSASPCVVCGDKSSGKHYGQLTCEGCKSFFKRSVRRNLSYTCRGSRDCAIDPQHRNQCQFCRLRKCIKAGMRREAVQRGRINPSPAIEYQYQIPPVTPNIDTSRLGACYVSSFVSLLLRAEPYPITHLQSQPAMSGHLEGFYELTARLFFAAIEWAKNIQYFIELPVIDQVSLLRNSWTELFILNTSQCCPPLYISSILTAISNSITDSRYGGQCSQDQLKLRHVQEQIERLASLHMDSAEYSCLKALALFSPDVLGLHDPGTVQNLQEKAQTSLDEYDKIQYNTQPGRSGRLLLRLPALKTLNPNDIERLFFAQLVDKTPMETIIRNMVIGANTFC